MRALRRFVLALGLILQVQTAYADGSEKVLTPQCGGLFGLCGYVARGTVQEIIPKTFERALRFSEGFAAVRADGKYGYIDRTGKVVIAPRFDRAGAFHQGLAEVLVEDATGVIDRTGTFVVEPKFFRAVPFTGDTLIAALGTPHKRARLKHRDLGNLQDPLVYFEAERVGLYHIKRGWVTDRVFEISSFDKTKRGLIWATRGKRHSGPFGLLRSDGTWQVEPIYSHVQSLREGRAVVRGPSNMKPLVKNGRTVDRSGAVDADGKLAVPIQFEHLSYWRVGYGVATQEGRKALIDPTGNVLGGRYFDSVDVPEDGRLPRVRIGKNWRSIQPDGTLISDQLDGTVLAQCPSGLTLRFRSGNVEISHPNLNKPIEQLFDFSFAFSKLNCANPVPVSSEGKRRYVTQNGVVLPSFDRTHPFKDGFANVKHNNAWGIIDETGRFVVEPSFGSIRYVQGVYEVKRDERVFWINAKGEEVRKPGPKPVDRAKVLSCRAGAKLFHKDDLWGMLGPDGRVLIQPVHRALWCYRNGVAWAATVKGTAWCPIGPDGQPKRTGTCRKTYYPYIRTHHGPQKFSDDPFENSVLWFRAFLDYGRGKRAEQPVWIPSRRGRMSSTLKWQ